MEEIFDELIDWSIMKNHDLPWRAKRSVYGTLVSEIMLQQTTVGTVKNHYSKFMERFPNVKKLASTKEADVLHAWRGLGYYRRAKSLWEAAKVIAHKNKGHVPEDYKSLIKIPGVGEYTANALLAIGYDKKAIALDANLERVISRLFAIEEPKGLKLQKKIQELFKSNKILDLDVSYRALNEALMDLGRTYCQANKVDCELCPLASICEAKKTNSMLKFPVEAKTKNTVETKTETGEVVVKKVKKKLTDVHLLRMIIKKEEGILFFERPEGKWLEKQLELPSFVLGRKTTDQYPFMKDFKKYRRLPRYKTFITNYRIHNFVHQSEGEDKLLIQKNFKYVPLDKLEDENLTTASLKALRRVKILKPLDKK